jgi:hypothetical protein
VAALVLRATVVAAAVGLLLLATPYIIDAISGFVDVLVIGAVVMLAVTRWGGAGKKGRRRR